MTGVSWHEGCPVGLGRLRLVRVTHLDFQVRSRSGRLVVHRRYAHGMDDVRADRGAQAVSVVVRSR